MGKEKDKKRQEESREVEKEQIKENNYSRIFIISERLCVALAFLETPTSLEISRITK